jgi:hypothetical protein
MNLIYTLQTVPKINFNNIIPFTTTLYYWPLLFGFRNRNSERISHPHACYMHQPMKQNNHITKPTHHRNLLKEGTEERIDQGTKLTVAKHPDSQRSQPKQRSQPEVGENYIEIKRVWDARSLETLPRTVAVCPTNVPVQLKMQLTLSQGQQDRWPYTLLIAALNFTETSLLTLLSKEECSARDLEILCVCVCVCVCVCEREFCNTLLSQCQLTAVPVSPGFSFNENLS